MRKPTVREAMYGLETRGYCPTHPMSIVITTSSAKKRELDGGGFAGYGDEPVTAIQLAGGNDDALMADHYQC